MEIDTVVCGDCLDVMAEMPDGCVDLVITSPPYANLRDYGNGQGKIEPDDYVHWFLPKAKEIKRILKPACSFVLNINDRVVKGERSLYVFDLVCAIKRVIGLRFVETYIWHKPDAMPGRYGPRLKDSFEYCFWFANGKPRFFIEPVLKPYDPVGLARTDASYLAKSHGPSGRTRNGSRMYRRNGSDPGNVVTIKKIVEKHSMGHGAEFPIDLPSFFINMGSTKSDLVFDPFMGSGTTAIAALKLGRHFYGCDISPEYVELANKRIEKARLEMAQMEMDLTNPTKHDIIISNPRPTPGRHR